MAETLCFGTNTLIWYTLASSPLFSKIFIFFTPFQHKFQLFWLFSEKKTLFSRNSADSSLFSASFCFFASFLQKFCWSTSFLQNFQPFHLLSAQFSAASAHFSRIVRLSTTTFCNFSSFSAFQQTASALRHPHSIFAGNANFSSCVDALKGFHTIEFLFLFILYTLLLLF